MSESEEVAKKYGGIVGGIYYIGLLLYAVLRKMLFDGSNKNIEK